MKTRLLHKLALLIITLFILQQAVLPQGFAGTLFGHVSDNSQAIIVNAVLTLTNQNTGFVYTANSDDAGTYRFLNITPGMYDLTIEKEGFAKQKIKDISVAVADQSIYEITLKAGNINESMTISAEDVLGRATTNVSGKVIRQQEITELPTLVRNTYEFVALSPGTVPTSDGRGIGISANGQRSSSGNYLLDGAENNDPFRAGVAQEIPLDSIKEMRIITNGFAAEYGRNVGFIANAISQSGENQFHGSAFDFNRNSALAANSFGNNAFEFPKPVFNRNQFGGTFSGPIRKNRAFFFASIEPIIVRSTDTIPFFVPTTQLRDISSPFTKSLLDRFQDKVKLPDGNTAPLVVSRTLCPFDKFDFTTFRCKTSADLRTIPAFAQITRPGPANVGAGFPQNTLLASGRFDFNIDSRTQVFGRYSYSKTDFFAPLSQPYSTDFDAAEKDRAHQILLSLTRTWGTNLVTETRLAYNRLQLKQPATVNFPVFSGGVVDLPSGSDVRGGPQNVYQFYQTATLSYRDHVFKFGGQYVHIRDNQIPVTLQKLPTVTFNNSLQNLVVGRAIYQLALDPKGATDGGTVTAPFTVPNSTRHYRYNEVSLFFQDTWKVTPRLTLSPGLRWEYFGVLHSVGDEKALDANFYYGTVGNIFERIREGSFLRTIDAPGKYQGHFYLPDYNNFAPRLGLAYDLTGDGKTVLRAGGGIYYDRNFGNVLSNVAINPPSYASVAFSSNLQPGFLDNPYGQLPNAFKLVFISARHLDQNLRTAYTASWNAGIEQQIGNLFLVDINYVGDSGSKLYSLADQNRVNSGRFLGDDISVFDPNNPDHRLRAYTFALNTRSNQGHSTYHGLQVQVESRNLKGLQFGVTYNYSHAIDNLSSTFGDDSVASNGGLQIGFLDPFNPGLDRGDADFDIRHRLVTNFVWEIPFGRQSSRWLFKSVLGGWNLSGILSFQTGQPFSIYDTGNLEAFGGVTMFRPKFSGTLSKASLIPDRTFPNSFLFLPLNAVRDDNFNCVSTGPFFCSAMDGESLDGTISRNIFRRPGTQFHNLAVSKNFALPRIFGREGAKLQVRAEFYNIFNHANLYVDSFANDVNNFFFENSQGDFVPGVTVRRGFSTNSGAANTAGLSSFIDNRQMVIGVKVIF